MQNNTPNPAPPNLPPSSPNPSPVPPPQNSFNQIVKRLGSILSHPSVANVAAGVAVVISFLSWMETRKIQSDENVSKYSIHTDFKPQSKSVFFAKNCDKVYRNYSKIESWIYVYITNIGKKPFSITSAEFNYSLQKGRLVLSDLSDKSMLQNLQGQKLNLPIKLEPGEAIGVKTLGMLLTNRRICKKVMTDQRYANNVSAVTWDLSGQRLGVIRGFVRKRASDGAIVWHSPASFEFKIGGEDSGLLNSMHVPSDEWMASEETIDNVK